MTDVIVVTRHADHIAEVMLNRPEALNSMNSEMARALTAACTDLAKDEDVHAVVLSGAPGRAFCAGADLKERGKMSDAEIIGQRPVIRAAFGSVLDLPQPAVAAVHGFALGGGCEFALSCDIIVADETAVFGLPEVTVGLVPGGGGTQLALRRLGAGLAADLILTGRHLPIEDAERAGLVDHAVEAGQARATALDLARKIAANSPVAVRAAKRALRQGWGVSLQAGLEIEDSAWRTAVLSDERRERVAAFGKRG